MTLSMIKNPNQTLWALAFKATRGTATYEVFLSKNKSKCKQGFDLIP